MQASSFPEPALARALHCRVLFHPDRVAEHAALSPVDAGSVITSQKVGESGFGLDPFGKTAIPLGTNTLRFARRTLRRRARL
jgi:hypothetical protein